MSEEKNFDGELERIIKLARDKGATDIYLTAGVPPEIKIEGRIHRMNWGALVHGQVEGYANRLLTSTEQKSYQEGKDVDFGIELYGLRMRGNAARAVDGPYLALRNLPDRIIPLEGLGLPNNFYEKAVRLQKGLILVTGATGNGKTTTLASFVDAIRRQGISRRVITIEDPIEYIHHQGEGLATVIQRQVPLHTPNFKTALRSAVRQNPNTIMIGEIRDLETLEIALGAADTGHLVLSTLHTASAAETIQRIALMRNESSSTYPVTAALASNLKYIVGQKLVPGIDGRTRLAAEILFNNHSVKNHINQWATLGNKATQAINNDIQLGAKDDMILLDKHLKDLVEQGIISKETAIDKANDQVTMQEYFEHNEL